MQHETHGTTKAKTEHSIDTTGSVDQHAHRHTQSIERIASPQRIRTPSAASTDDERDAAVRGGIDAVMNDREAEKLETSAKQRDHYLHTGSSYDTDSTPKLGLWKFTSSLFTDIDTHTEHLYYILTVEIFSIFLTFTHYPYLDKKNKFLTPIIMGSQTSLLGETLRQIYSWRHKSCIGNLNFAAADEEMMCFDTQTTLRPGHQKHKRSPSTTSTVGNIDVTDACLREHLKFLVWGSLNGLFSSYWIDFLVALFTTTKIFCVGVDQTVGTLFFQTLYSLFVCLWDGEIEVVGCSSGKSKHVELTWDAFSEHYLSMLWKYMKLSWMVWPWVSLVCFTTLPTTWIFPLNCLCTTVFTVLLGL